MARITRPRRILRVRRPARRIVLLLVLSALATMGLTSCAAAWANPAESGATLRLGYFANVTHAPALVGVREGLFDTALSDFSGGNVTVHTQVLSAGPSAIEALNAGAIDAAYLGPGPALNSYLRSEGQSLRVVAGAAAGGAALVVREGITSAADLAGASLASPGLGSTQDVALRAWLDDQGYPTSLTGTAVPGGNDSVSVAPINNAQAFLLFQRGEIDGAWVPEPWLSRFEQQAGGHVLVDEATLWPDGLFPTTLLVVRADFAAQHPETVEALVAGHHAALTWIAEHPETLTDTVGDALSELTGARLPDAVIRSALDRVTFTDDPLAATFSDLVAHAEQAGTLPAASAALFRRGTMADDVCDLEALNWLRASEGEPARAGVRS